MLWYKCGPMALFLDKETAKFLTEHGAWCEEMKDQSLYRPKAVSISSVSAELWAKESNKSIESLAKYL